MKEPSAAAELPGPSRSPWQLFYGGIHRLRSRWWRHRARRLPRPVVSVGNLHWGGTGKTPLVAAIAAHLRDRGLRVAILSRGYRRRTGGTLLVGRGHGAELDPWQAGDEPHLLASSLPGVAVAVGKDRWRAGELALATLTPAPDLFLLDDGFSHLALARDLDLLVLPSADPFGGGKLPPGGRLREPLAAAARAHAVLLSGEGADDRLGAHRVSAALEGHGFSGPVFTATLEARILPDSGRPAGLDSTAEPNPTDGSESGDSDRRGSPPLLLVTGIARPERAAATARACGAQVLGHLAFGDHHPYPSRSLRSIETRCRSLGAEGVLTTGKDAAKLRGRLSLPLWEISVTPRPEPELWAWLDDHLKGLG